MVNFNQLCSYKHFNDNSSSLVLQERDTVMPELRSWVIQLVVHNLTSILLMHFNVVSNRL